MSSVTPIISVYFGGMKEAIDDHETGVLISHHSEKEFAEKIKLLQHNEDLRHHLGSAARQKAEKSFSLSNMINSTLETYQY